MALSSRPKGRIHVKKSSQYSLATSMAIAGAGAALACGAGLAQAAPVLTPPLSPATSTGCPVLTAQCAPTGQSLFGARSLLTTNLPTSPGMAAAFIGPVQFTPLYQVINLVGLVPIVNIFVHNGTNGGVGTGVNGG